MAELDTYLPPKQAADLQSGSAYMYFAFSRADSAKLRELLERLWTRGIRFWYSLNNEKSSKEQEENIAIVKAAKLMLVYESAAAERDVELKNKVIVAQRMKMPIIIIREDKTENAQALGLYEKYPYINIEDLSSCEELEQAIIHAAGFSMELVGRGRELPSLPPAPVWKKLLAAFGVLIIILGLGATLIFSLGLQYRDTVEIKDPVILDAAHKALGASLTEESIGEIRALSLEKAPESFVELELFPALERLEIPASAVEAAAFLTTDTDLTIVVRGGK